MSPTVRVDEESCSHMKKMALHVLLIVCEIAYSPIPFCTATTDADERFLQQALAQ